MPLPPNFAASGPIRLPAFFIRRGRCAILLCMSKRFGTDSLQLNDDLCFVVFDLEWNQCPYGKEHENKDLPFEIIDIGAVKLDRNREAIATFHQYVRPSVYKRLHHRTKKVIGIEVSDIERGLPFPDAARGFLGWCGPNAVFCTWGDQDLYELQRNLRYYGMLDLLPGPLLYEDVQKLFAVEFEDRSVRRSLEYAADYLSIEKTREYHRAYDDALYTAAVMTHLSSEVITSEYSLDCYQHPTDPENEIKIRYSTHEKYISRTFPDRQTAIRDREVASMHCPVCGRNAKRIGRWIVKDAKHYISAARCKDHGYLTGRIRVKVAENDQVYMEKITRMSTEEEALGSISHTPHKSND